MSTPFNWYRSGLRCVAFSLIELLVAMAILAMLAALAVPSFTNFIQRHHFKVRCDRLRHALSYAQALAIRSKRQLFLCGSRDGLHCDGDWNASWLIVDSNRHVLHRFKPITETAVRIHWQGNYHQRPGIQFNADGDTSGQQGRFYLQLGVYHEQLVLSLSGRVRQG